MRQADTTGREIAVAGTFNFRDVGGMRTRGGTSVRPGVLYRSEDLGPLEPEGVTRLRDLGVASVLDLRTTAEIARHGRFPFEEHGIGYRHLPLLESPSVEPEAAPRDLPPDVVLRISRRIAIEGAAAIGR